MKSGTRRRYPREWFMFSLGVMVSVALVGSIWGLRGCFYVSREMRVWTERISLVSGLASTLSREGRPILDRDLLLTLGKPDLVATPAELIEQLEDDPKYRHSILAGLWRAYKDRSEDLPTDWSERPDFANCSIWLYDESCRFRRPRPWVGYFIGHVFFVVDSRVVATGCISPLRKTRFTKPGCREEKRQNR